MSIASDLKVRISANADKFDSAMKRMEKRFDKSVRKLERTGKKLTQRVTLPLAAMGAAAVKSSIDFESAFAGVRKTVDATEGEFASLRKGILDMSKELPTSANEIAGVAEAAGQLGIKTDAILEFSKTMVMLGDTTNLAAQEAATALARIANIMQLPQDQFDEMGSVIVDLGNNFATTEREIVDFASRIAGAGQIAGLAASDIFGIATAMTSVGVEAGLGGTAVQKVMLAINNAVAQGNEDLQTFADTAGVSAEQFQTMWRDDAAQGFAAFVNGLGRQGDNAANTLDELGLADQRLMRAFLSLANAGDLVNRTLDVGSKAQKENTALTKEAEQRYKTIASRLSTLKNRIVALGVSIGDALMPKVEATIEAVESLTKWFDNLGVEGKATALTVAGLAAASGPFAMLIAKIYKAVKAIKAMNLAWAATPWGVAVAGITAVGSALVIGTQRINAFESAVDEALTGDIGEESMDNLIQLIDTTSKKLQDVKDKHAAGVFGDHSKSIENLENKLDSLIKRMHKLAQHQIKNIIDEDEAEHTKKVADQMERVEQAAASLQEIQARPSIGQAGAPSLLSMPKVDFSQMKASIIKQGEELSEVTKIALAGSVEAFDEAQMKIAQRAESFANIMEQVMADAIISFSKNVGKLAAGAGSIKDIAVGLINVLADMAIQIGSLFVSLGVAAAASLNPATLIATMGTSAIAAGAALIAAGAALKAIFSDASSRDIGGPAMKDHPFLIGKGPHQELFVPERSGSIVPNNKLRGMGGRGMSEDSMTRAFAKAMQSANWRIKGTDLVLTLENARKGKLR